MIPQIWYFGVSSAAAGTDQVISGDGGGSRGTIFSTLGVWRYWGIRHFSRI